MMLRPQQAALVRELRQSANKEESRCQQMIMGGGKSAVIAPLLSLLLVDGKKLIVLIVPDALLDMSTNVTRGAFGPTIPTPVLNFAFERSGSDDMLRQLRQINRKLRFTRDKYGVICTTPGAIKSLFLTYIDRLHIEERVDNSAYFQQRYAAVRKTLPRGDRSKIVEVARELRCSLGPCRSKSCSAHCPSFREDYAVVEVTNCQ